MNDLIFGMPAQGENMVTLLDASAFDEKFAIELENDYIYNIHHIENKYHVPVLSGGYREMYEYSREYLIHPHDKGYDQLMDPDTLLDQLAQSDTPGVIKAEFREKLIDGSYRWVQYIGVSGKENGVPEGTIFFYVFDIQNQKDRMVGAPSSNPDRRKRDSVTGLRTRDFFAGDALKLAQQGVGPWCCLALDIQNFKVFNLWFGHDQGTYLLCCIGDYLLGLENELNAVAAYFGRDNFGLFMRNDEGLIQRVFDDVRAIVSKLSGIAGFLPAIGVCVLAEGELPGLDTYDRARLMVADAKKTFTDRIAFFDNEVFYKARRDYEELTEFQRALKNDEICFFVQPQCGINTGKILGGEVLARWIKPDGTAVSPGQFIPVLESTGLVTLLDKTIWEQACKWLRSLRDRGLRAVPVSVNVSQIDIVTFDVPDYLTELVERYEVSPHLLKVEVTESAYANSFELISQTVQRLNAAGFSVMLDDFGSGYSSLSMLDKVKVDVLKLDMAFMQKDSSMSKKGISIVESIMGLTKALDIPVIVEGLEDDEQAAFLKKLGCKYAQGYYFYKPMSVKDFEGLLATDGVVAYKNFTSRSTDFFHANEFLQGSLFNDITLNRILGAAAYYTLEGKNLTITRYNEQFYLAIGDEKMDRRIENIQNFVPVEDHPMLYRALQEAQDNVAEGGSCEVRFWKSDNSIFWFRMQFYLLKDDGDCKQFFGQVEDITESREQSISFFEVLREQADVSMRMDLERNIVQYVTKGHTLNQIDLPSVPLGYSIEQTALNRIESKADQEAFREFFDSDRLREAYRKAIYHEVLNVDFKLHFEVEPMEFSTYYIRYSKNQNLNVYVFARRRDRELLEKDALTGLGNRHSFNESVRALDGHPELFSNLIIFSMDVNGLKDINDTLGHMAGDEVIRGAASCIDQVMSPYGKCFRVSGDEFSAFVYGDRSLGDSLRDELTRALSNWHGKYVETVSASCGYAVASDYPDITIGDLIKVSDHEMYLAKSRHYQQKGVDRRVQQAAYNALCDSYAKILKVNLTKDQFEVIRAEDSELDSSKGYNSRLSVWIEDFAKTSQVHPDDKQAYLEELDVEKLRCYFAQGETRFSTRYRRIYEDRFSMVLLELMRAPDYTDDNQSVFLYVKAVDR